MLSPAEREAILAGTTTTVELAGKVLGIGRARAYKSAEVGEIPTIRFGKALRVPTAPLRVMLGLDAKAAA